MLIRQVATRCREVLSSKTRYRELLTRRSTLFVAVIALAVPVGVVAMTTLSDASATGQHSVTLVNNSGAPLWIGSGVNADGSQDIANLPILAAGQSATVAIPDGGSPDHWRGKFFARQGCSGQSGSTFHCLVGDCGAFADHCAQGQQPTSLAEFNFDRSDPGATWYDVSYVDAVSLGITISSPDSSGAVSGSCQKADCSGGQLLAACPAEDAQTDPQTGQRISCVNPSRDDGGSTYALAMLALDPRGYVWSTEDQVPGNSTMFNCTQCANFVITFHGAGGGSGAVPDPSPTAVQPRPTGPDQAAPGAGGFILRGLGGKCVDVPGSRSDDGARLQMWPCNNTGAQEFTAGAGGSLVVLGKCMDAAGAGRGGVTRVRIARCDGGPAQTWAFQDGTLRNPNSGKCLDVRWADTRIGAQLVIWDCHGQANQQWTQVFTGPGPVAGGQPMPAPASGNPPVPASVPAGGQPGPAAGNQSTIRAYITGYSFFDNTPPGSADISHPILHNQAAGTGTYADPITVAVGHSLAGGGDALDWPAGTRFYVPNLRRYFIVEDTCGDGPTPQDGACHVGFPSGASTWLDVWTGGQGGSASGSDDCMNAITDVWDVLVNPGPNDVVVSGPIYGGAGCTAQFGNAVVTA